MLDWLGMPVAASAHAGEVDRIMVLVHWLMLVLFVGWSIFFVYVLVRFRRRRASRADYHGVRGGWSTWIEGGVLVAEIVLLAFFSIPFWTRERGRAAAAESEATVVRVVAEQFAWNVHYPGADGVFGRTDITLVEPGQPARPRSRRSRRQGRHHRDRPAEHAGRQAGARVPVEQGRGAQLRPAADAREAGRGAGHRAAGLVHADDDRAVGHRVLAAVRPGALPHEGGLPDPDARPTTTPG